MCLCTRVESPVSLWVYFLRRSPLWKAQSESCELHASLLHCCEVFIIMHWFVRLYLSSSAQKWTESYVQKIKTFYEINAWSSTPLLVLSSNVQQICNQLIWSKTERCSLKICQSKQINFFHLGKNVFTQNN